MPATTWTTIVVGEFSHRAQSRVAIFELIRSVCMVVAVDGSVQRHGMNIRRSARRAPKRRIRLREGAREPPLGADGAERLTVKTGAPATIGTPLASQFRTPGDAACDTIVRPDLGLSPRELKSAFLASSS